MLPQEFLDRLRGQLGEAFDAFLQSYVEEMRNAPDFGVNKEPQAKTIVIDYGGPNVAKPLHIGHLRSAIIGESVKRIYKFFGNRVIGDVHLGDWGLQMGLIIAGLQEQQPELLYFDESYTGSYPEQPPFTLGELEKIYPAASARSKVDAAFAEKAHQVTFELQSGRPGYRALWRHIMNASIPDVRRIYEDLDVHFESWLGESDADPYIPDMVENLKAQGFAVESNGALIFPVAQEGDKKEMPPCILIKSDGAVLYDTTELATMVQRERDFHPDQILYLADKRQSLHFEQVFRAARMAHIIRPETQMQFLGFGTMNGKDGKPFKTRDGGVMRLETLISDIMEFVGKKVRENQVVEADQVEETTRRIAMAALKYGDLSNQPTKDYIFDMDRFAAFEGNTGPYILYTIVRIKSILTKFAENGGKAEAGRILPPASDSEKGLALQLLKFNEVMETSFEDLAPHKVCQYIYELSNEFNRFYHDTKILSEEDPARQAGYISLIMLTKDVLTTAIGGLGIEAPERM